MGKKDPTKPGVVYVVTDKKEPDRVRYVGRTVQGVSTRASKHWGDCQNLRTAFPNWLRSRLDRKDDVVFTVISEHPNVPELNNAEIEAIAHYRSIGQADLNLTDGGDGSSPGPWSEERIRNHFNNVGRGDDHCHSVLNWEAVREARKRATKEYLNAAKESKKWGVCVATYSEMLRNETWHDPEYDPSKRVPRPMTGQEAGNARLTQKQVDEIRALRQREYLTNQETGERYGVTKDMIWRIVNNLNWHDPTFDPSTIKPRGRKK